MTDMKYSFHIKNGHVVDPASGIDGVRDIHIANSRIAPPPGDGAAANQVVDASGCFVFPGLIDFHTHLDRGHSDAGIHPDLMTLPNGVTAAVDAGSTGSSNFDGFYRNVIHGAETTVKAFINIVGPGLSTECYVERLEPEYYDKKRIAYMFERYGDGLLGLKVRIGKLFSGDLGLVPLIETRKLARELGTRVCVHAVHPESPYDEILALLDEGDILCHCFQNKGGVNILDDDGKVGRGAHEARERGVVFDTANGRGNYSFGVAKKAYADGFLPDVISTDVVDFSIYQPQVFSLPYVMAGYLGVGMPLIEVIRRVTETPARLMGLAGEIGTLAPGALADVAIFKFMEAPIVIRDQLGDEVKARGLLSPMMTVKAGRTAYTNIEFAFRNQ